MKYNEKTVLHYLFLLLYILFYPLVGEAIKPIPPFELGSNIGIGGGYKLFIKESTDSKSSSSVLFFFDLDLLWNRKDNFSFGVGVRNYLGTIDFRSIYWGSGLEVLFPLSTLSPLIVAFVPFVDYRVDRDSLSLGFKLTFWQGIRPHNYYFFYNHSLGVWLSVIFLDSIIGDLSQDLVVLFTLGIGIDTGFILVYPWLYLYQRLK